MYEQFREDRNVRNITNYNTIRAILQNYYEWRRRFHGIICKTLKRNHTGEQYGTDLGKI
jgi:hypothetical protein